MTDTDYVSASIFRIIDQGFQSSETGLSLSPDFSVNWNAYCKAGGACPNACAFYIEDSSFVDVAASHQTVYCVCVVSPQPNNRAP